MEGSEWKKKKKKDQNKAKQISLWLQSVNSSPQWRWRMEDKCSQLTLSEVPAAKEQQGPGPRVPLLSHSSLLAAQPRRETQYLIFPSRGGHRPHGDTSKARHAHHCSEFHLPWEGTTVRGCSVPSSSSLPAGCSAPSHCRRGQQSPMRWIRTFHRLHGSQPGLQCLDVMSFQWPQPRRQRWEDTDEAAAVLPCSLPRERAGPSSTIRTWTPRF